LSSGVSTGRNSSVNFSVDSINLTSSTPDVHQKASWSVRITNDAMLKSRSGLISRKRLVLATGKGIASASTNDLFEAGEDA
jgi:hypothetical protein